MSLSDLITRVVDHRDLDASSMERAMRAILDGEATPAEIAGLAIALRMKGETVEEIAAAARVMRDRCARVTVECEGPLLDTCGTGGDGSGSFNVSTCSAVVAAAAGARVAKHGNRAVSSRAGSADVLEALGLSLDADVDVVAQCIREVGIGFLFAPAHHEALRHAAPVRRALGVRTFFNLLGPLTNPAAASHQLVGVYEASRVSTLAAVLGELGSKVVWVVHGAGGLDEVSPLGPTEVAEWRDGQLRTFVVEPADFGVAVTGPEALAGGDANDNAGLIRDILDGGGGARREVVVLNAAAALVVAEVESDYRAAAERARAAIDRGDARALLERWLAYPSAAVGHHGVDHEGVDHSGDEA